jgi:hypothetical protein
VQLPRYWLILQALIIIFVVIGCIIAIIKL